MALDYSSTVKSIRRRTSEVSRHLPDFQRRNWQTQWGSWRSDGHLEFLPGGRRGVRCCLRCSAVLCS